MARDDPPANSTVAQAARRAKCAVKWDRKLKPKLAIMRQCTSVTDRRTDGLASWHKREMYITSCAKKIERKRKGGGWHKGPQTLVPPSVAGSVAGGCYYATENKILPYSRNLCQQPVSINRVGRGCIISDCSRLPPMLVRSTLHPGARGRVTAASEAWASYWDRHGNPAG